MNKLRFPLTNIILILSLFIINKDIHINTQILNNSSPTSSIQKDKIIYLTFDDGPSENTLKILDILDKYEIVATFFVVGPSYKQKNDLLIETINRGHSLAIHSYEHTYSYIYSSYENYLNDFKLCLQWIKSITNTTPTIYRFPGGSSNTITSKKFIQTIISILDEEGYKHVDWNVDSLDSKYNTNSSLIEKQTIMDIAYNEKKQIHTHTLLMHDNTKKVGTLEALPTIIEYCLSKGYQFKTISNESYLIQHVKKP